MPSSPRSSWDGVKQQPPSLAIAGIGPPPPVLLGAGQWEKEKTPKKKVRIDETMSEIFELQPIDMDLTRDATSQASEDRGARCAAQQEHFVRVARGLSWISLAASVLVATFAVIIGISD